MNGKKAAIILIGIIVLSALAAAIAIQLFFATYEPKEANGTSLLPSISQPYVIG